MLLIDKLLSNDNTNTIYNIKLQLELLSFKKIVLLTVHCFLRIILLISKEGRYASRKYLRHLLSVRC